jgi:hypothetical protein
MFKTNEFCGAKAGPQGFLNFALFEGIVSRDFGILFLFYWIDMKFVLEPDQVYFSF